MKCPLEHLDEVLSEDLGVYSVVLHHPERHERKVLLVLVCGPVDLDGKLYLFVEFLLQAVMLQLQLFQFLGSFDLQLEVHGNNWLFRERKIESAGKIAQPSHLIYDIIKQSTYEP